MSQSKLERIRALAAQNAETADDMTQEVKGGSGRRILETGTYMCRLTKYIEFGQHPQEFEGKSTGNALEFRLGFAIFILKPDVRAALATNPGLLQDPSSYEVVRMNTFELKHSRNVKAKAFKLFKRLNWKGTAKTFAELLGEPFMMKVEKYQGTDKQDRNKIDFDGFSAPIDPISQAPYFIPQAADEDYQCFIWATPTLEDWNDLHIDGTTDDGKSKNFLQDKCLSAIDFHGSPLEGVLLASGMNPAAQGAAGAPLPPLPAEAPPAAPPAPVVQTPAPTLQAAPALPEMPAFAPPPVA